MDSDVLNMVAPAPTLKTLEISTPMALRDDRRDSPAEASEPRRIILNPRWDSSAPSVVSPTRSTSAPATPSGYGRSEWVTKARRSGME